VLILRCFGASIHRSAMIHPSALIEFPWNFSAGENVIIEHCVIINCMGRIEIGDGTRISQYAHLCAGTHNYRDRRMPIVRRSIHVGRNVWIAADAFVGPGVRIGDGSLLAARSSAFGNLPAGQICVGEPARPRKKRFEEPAPAREDVTTTV
jgi:putative colanic acid biosynthesis acetyltransferase WcaF